MPFHVVYLDPQPASPVHHVTQAGGKEQSQSDTQLENAARPPVRQGRRLAFPQRVAPDNRHRLAACGHTSMHERLATVRRRQTVETLLDPVNERLPEKAAIGGTLREHLRQLVEFGNGHRYHPLPALMSAWSSLPAVWMSASTSCMRAVRRAYQRT